ncbi:MAG TPA: phosphatase PAP2 family protein [Jatrophihabitans sp.]|nr:phosphatase PAP2 family protein [Jatrophihabitans sp.]
MSNVTGSIALPPAPADRSGADRRRPADPAKVLRPVILGEVALVLLLLRAYDAIRAHAEVRTGPALRNGWDLLHAERLLHLNLELSVNHWASLHRAVSLAASYWYQFFHVSVTLLVLLWCYWRRPGSYRRARNALALTNVFGLAFFLLYPAAPPRLLPSAGFVDAVANAGFGTSHGGPVTADQYGAFPSLHLAWAVWTAVVAARLVRPTWLRRLWLCYPLITATVVVATGNHYLLDVLGGIGIALVSLALAHRYPRSRQYGRAGTVRAGLRRLRTDGPRATGAALLQRLPARRRGDLPGPRIQPAGSLVGAQANGDDQAR